MFKKKIVVIISALLAFATQAETFVEGKDYTVLKKQAVTQPTSQKVKVTDFFSYGCPWCFKLDKPLDDWAKQNKARVLFKKVPVVFNKSWELYAKSYYTIEALAPAQNIDDALFDAIINQNQKLNTSKEMAKFLSEHGLSEEIALNALNHSPSIEIQLKNDKKMMADYQITAIPAVIVQDKYKTDMQMAQGKERFFEILDFLVQKSSASAPSN